MIYEQHSLVSIGGGGHLLLTVWVVYWPLHSIIEHGLTAHELFVKSTDVFRRAAARVFDQVYK